MEDPWNYRNKIIYPVGTVASTGRLIAGYFKRNTNELINVKYCPIQYSIFDEIMEFTKDLCSKRGITKDRLRHILMRSNMDQSEILLSLIIRRKNLNHEEHKLLIKILKEIRSKFPIIKVISLNYNDLSTNVILGQKTEVIDERAYIQEKFADIELRISTASFFQVNTKQFLKIINLIKTFIDKPNARILDLYCGIGTISLSLAKALPELNVTGVEIVAEAIDAKFILGTAEDALADILDLKSPSSPYDIVIVNPPRKGCTNDVLNALGEIQSAKIIYVSCNPATLTRDIKHLEQYGYKLSSAQPVDMFPHSFHVETVAVLVHELSS
jgi:23S rRNA (uracil1939-C5)-methyltransferase